ncbi:MAG: SemiSWEET transporter [Candidatus Gastranaerophilaceae bacterium]|jgi:MtN3 and saliva related transmembrane protein
MNVELIGYLAGLLSTIAFVPQVIQVVKTKSTKDISLIMFTVFSSGILAWLIYGIFVHSLPMMIFNSLIFLQSLVIIAYKLRYK